MALTEGLYEWPAVGPIVGMSVGGADGMQEGATVGNCEKEDIGAVVESDGVKVGYLDGDIEREGG